MDKSAASKRLRDLATDAKRSKAARLRDVIDDVENALAAGATQAAVRDVLADLGLPMSAATFQGTLSRIRAKRSQPPSRLRTPKAAPITSNSAEPTPQSPAPLEAPASSPSSSNPTDLDQIFRSTPDLNALARIARRKKK